MFTITVQTIASGYSNTTAKTLEVRSFETREEAKKEVRKMMKNEGYKKHYNNYFNPTANTELFFNY